MPKSASSASSTTLLQQPRIGDRSVGVQSGAVAGPGLEKAPTWAAVFALGAGLLMILNGVRRIWSGLFERGVVRRPPPGDGDTQH
jgi:hypothetical protein